METSGRGNWLVSNSDGIGPKLPLLLLDDVETFCEFFSDISRQTKGLVLRVW